MSDWVFRDDGSLEEGPIMIAIFSPSSYHEEGSPLMDVDFSTERNYGLLCAAGKGKHFTEHGHELRCKACESIVGYRAVEESLH